MHLTGAAIRHSRARQVEGNKLAVDFDKAGEKRVIDSFVVPASAA